MNIFYLNSNPEIAAQEHVDRHVVKMILESAQLLCTAHRISDGCLTTISRQTSAGKVRNVKTYVHPNPNLDTLLYSCTHANHPCAIWARETINNYMWLYELFVALCDEYTFRYGKTHKTDSLLREVLRTPPTNIKRDGFTFPPQAMPTAYKHADAVVAYRNYYVGAKAKFAKWTKRPIPNWFAIGEAHANV